MNPSAGDDAIALRPPDAEAVSRVFKSPDVAHVHERWLARATRHDDVRYFSVYRRDALVGQIVLHDIDWQTGEALVAYHLFDERWRGRGIGTHALALLKRYVVSETALARLVIIAAEDNAASRRVAEKCGFRLIGRSRESAAWFVYRWEVPRS